MCWETELALGRGTSGPRTDVGGAQHIAHRPPAGKACAPRRLRVIVPRKGKGSKELPRRWPRTLPLPACGERAGVRGRAASLSVAARSSPPPPPPPPPAGGGGGPPRARAAPGGAGGG